MNVRKLRSSSLSATTRKRNCGAFVGSSSPACYCRVVAERCADEFITPVSAEATHTLVVPLAMFVHCLGDFKKSVSAFVMYARDNDKYASVVGALAGPIMTRTSFPKIGLPP